MERPSESRRDGLRSWYASHRRGVTIAVATTALILLGVAGAIGPSILRSTDVAGITPSATPETSSATPPTTSPSRSPSPSPAIELERSPSPSPSPPTQAADGYYPLFPGVWAEVKVDDLRVREGPGTEHDVVGALDEGDLVMSIDSLGAGMWVHVLADGAAGYVNAGQPDDPWVLAIPTPLSWTHLEGVTSNGSTYLAYGTWAELDYPPYEGGFEQPLLLYSDDGVSWHEQHEGPPGRVLAAAPGPAGWVALSFHQYGGGFASFSPDGRSWHQPTSLSGMAHSVAYGPAGWVALGSTYDEGIRAWISPDGRTWSANPVSVPGSGSQPALEASDAGYVAVDRHAGTLVGSVDGRIWNTTPRPGPSEGWIADVELIGERVLAVVIDATTGASQIHTGRLGAEGAIAWDGKVGDAAFAGRRVDSIEQSPDALIALGWDPQALVPAAWSSADGVTWNSLGISPEAFGGMVGPRLAWGAGGWVGLGTHEGGHAVWRSDDGSTWELATAPQRTERPVDCSRFASASVLALMYLGGDAVDCFGGTTLTLRGWVPLIEGLGGCCFPESEPDWLAGPYPTAWLTPGQADHMGVHLHVPPTVDATALTPHRWVEVTGHYLDPAAEQCRSEPLSSYPHRLESQVSVREACRARFVVESAREIPAP